MPRGRRAGQARRLTAVAVTLSLLVMFTPLACGSQRGTRVRGHDLQEFYDLGSIAADMVAAAARGDSAAVARHVRAGADPNAPGRDGMLPLTWAFLAGSEPGVRALLVAGADPNRRNGTFRNDRPGWAGLPPIALVVGAPDPKWLTLLLSHGGDPNAVGVSAEPILFDAIGTMQVPRVRALVERGANVNARSLGNMTPLVAAASLNQFQIVRYLLERGADWRARGGLGLTLAYLVQDRTLDPDARELVDAQRWVRAFLESQGVRFPVPEPAEQRRLDSLAAVGARAPAGPPGPEVDISAPSPAE